jgi:hypothetical protein
LVNAGFAVVVSLGIDNQRPDVEVEWLNVSDNGCLNHAVPMFIDEFLKHVFRFRDLFDEIVEVTLN